MQLNILQYWGIDAVPVPATPTTWDVGGDYVLKRVKAVGHAGSNIGLSAALRAEGVPVADMIPALDGRDYIEIPEGCYLLMKRLGGGHIRDIFGQDYEAIAYQSGLIIAKIHRALAKITDQPQVQNKPFDEELQGWISDRLSTDGSMTDIDWTGLIRSLCEIYPQLPKQQIHRDLHYGNMLFDGTTLTGVLDFDLGKEDARVFDIAYFLLGQLLGQQDLNAVRDQWLSFIRRFLEGYESITPLEACEKDVMPLMMQCIELLFLAFWQRQGNRDAAVETMAIFQFVSRTYQQ